MEELKVCCEATVPKSIFMKIIHRICRAFRLFIRAIKDIFRPRKGMTGWACREVELACVHEREGNNTPDGDWDYGCACYESALKAFKSLMKDGHSGFSIGATHSILNRLIEGRPLTPIIDTPDVWNNISDISGSNDEESIYQCKRMSSLFKYVYPDGSTKYREIDAHYCIDIGNESTYHSGLVQGIIDEMFPIEMPYWPTKPIRVYCEEFLTDRKNGDFDTVGIFYAVKPNDERVEIHRFFKEESTSKSGWAEINNTEYFERKKLAEQIKETKEDSPCVINNPV